ncbi:MAG: hypothetical protein EAZ40_04505 [Rhodobacterales bacterium]|nr:MAG: hypothetical protein EAZ40_04505 [Rhodobacterales bacterium]
MTFRAVMLGAVCLAIGAGLPSLWRSFHADPPCGLTDAGCFANRAAKLLDPDQAGSTDLYHGIDAYDRREAARERLAALQSPAALPTPTVKDLTAAVIDGTLPPGTNEERWRYILRAFIDLREADHATATAVLDLFEAKADLIRDTSHPAYHQMLFWLAVNDIDRLARVVRFDEIERTGGEFDEQAEFLRASLLVHDCERLRAAGEDPAQGLTERMQAAEIGFSSLNLRGMLAMGVLLHCDGEAAARAALSDQLAWITPDNTVLQRDLMAADDARDPQDAVDNVVWASFAFAFPLTSWHLAAGRPAEARAAFDAMAPRTLAASLDALDPTVPALFDRQFLTWGALLDLWGRNRLYLAPSDLALTFIATEFDPQVRSGTRDTEDIARAFTLIEAAWPTPVAQTALWRLGQSATNASSVEVLRLTTLLRLVKLDRKMGCDLPQDLMTEVRDRVEGTGFGGSRMTRLERAELAVAAAEALQSPEAAVPEPGYRCIYPQLHQLWHYSGRNITFLATRSLPIRE